MGLKNWSYWVKGGIVGDMAFVILAGITYGLAFVWHVPISIYLVALLPWSINPFVGFGFSETFGGSLIVSVLAGLINYFIIGSIIGLIIGRRKQSTL